MFYETAFYDDCAPHRHAVYGPGLSFCEVHQHLLVDVDKVLGNAGLDDRPEDSWVELAIGAYETVEALYRLPIPCVVVLRRGGEVRAYKVDVRFTTKGAANGQA